MVMPDNTMRAIHLWGDRLEAWLKAVREAGIAGHKLNKKKLSVSFPETLKIPGNAAKWMSDQLDAVDGLYEDVKKSAIESLGYESGLGEGKITFRVTDAKQLAHAFLGLEESLPVSHFSFTKSRFGIPSKEPDISVFDGSMTITPDAIGQCQAWLKGPDDEPSLTLTADVFGFALPGRPNDEAFLRFSAPPLEIVKNAIGPYEISIRFNTDAPQPLSKWLQYAKLIRWSGRGLIRMRLSAGTRTLIEAPFKLDGEVTGQLIALCQAIVGIDYALRMSGRELPPVSEKDFSEAFKAISKYASGLPPELDVYLEQQDGTGKLNSVVYRTGLDLKGLSIHSFVTRPIVFDEVDKYGRFLRVGEPIFHETYTIDTDDFTQEWIEAEYTNFKTGLTAAEVMVDLGNIMDLAPIPPERRRKK